MKKTKFYMMLLAVFALLLASCSKDEEAVNENDKVASLSFTTVLNDLVASKTSLKQQLDIPACSDDAPAFVAVVLTGETNVGTVEDPLIVSVNPNPDNFDDDPEEEYFTEESSELELVPGEYTLEYFAVYNGDPSEDGTKVLWVAPREDGALASLVDTPLPFTFDLGPGAKKYVDVEVLCFDDRMVNEYGYLFFDLETTRAIELCVFGNFCDANGRHFPASFSVSVWEYSNGAQGDLIHEDLTNTVTMNDDGDFSASTLCFALPDTSGEDEYWVEITLLDSDAYDTQERIIRSGVITDAEVRALFDGEDSVDYYHFREGNCDSGDIPELFDDGEEPSEEDADNDGIIDGADNCPNTANADQTDSDGDGIGDVCDDCPNENPETDADGDGCEDETTDPDSDGDGVPDSVDECPSVDPVTDADGDGCEDETTDTDSDGDGVPDSVDSCPNVDPVTDADGDGCEDETTDTDSDGDGIPDSTDQCPSVNPTTDEDGDGCEDENVCAIAAPGTGCDIGQLEGEAGFVLVQNDLPLDLISEGNLIGPVAVTISGGALVVDSNLLVSSNAQITAYEVEVSATASGEGSITMCQTFTDPVGAINVNFGDIGASYPYYVRLKVNACPAN